MINYTKITSLNDINFDSLFQGTLPYMLIEQDYFPINIDTDEKRKQATIESLEAILSMPNSACFKVLDDENEIAALFGFIQDDMYIISYALLQDDINGSRSYIHDPKWFDNIKTFATAEGATYGGIYFFDTSPTLPSAKIIYGKTDSDITTTNIDGKNILLMRLW